MNPTPIKSWYRIRAARKTAEIRIYEEIGMYGVTAKQFLDDLAALGDLESLSVRINSPGGDVSDGMAIHNALQRQSGKVTTHIDGLCASIATVIALAGDEIHMVNNGLYMIHEPWVAAIGDSEDMQKSADLLDGIANQIVAMYARKTGMEPDAIRAMMREETWMTAEQALEYGFIDVIDEPLRIAAKAHPLTHFKNAPKDPIMSDPQEPTNPQPPDANPNEAERPLDAVTIARLCNTAQEPCLTPTLLATPHTEAQVKARLDQAKAIRALCASVNMADRAAELIAADKTVDQAKLALWDSLVARDQATPTIDSSQPAPIPDGLPVDARCEAEWNRNPALRAEFGELKIYQAFARAQEAGRIKVYGGKP